MKKYIEGGEFMFNFFSFKKKPQEKDEKINSLLLEKLDRVIELLEQRPKETSGNIHLEHVQVDHLENIIFRMDNIEIDELSGKLLIGTNISGPEDLPASLIDKETAKKEAAMEESPQQPIFTKTEKGYRFHR